MSFEILPWAFDDVNNRLVCRYRCSTYGDFEESFTLPSLNHNIHVATPFINLLTWLVGISYYKAAAAPTIKGAVHHSTFKPAIKAFYQEGLGEFFIRNDLAYPYAQNFLFSTDQTQTQPLDGETKTGKALCAFGGGKDSYTALHLLEKANVKTDLLSVVSNDRLKQTLSLSCSHPPIFIHRKIDPKLLEINKTGALNGHVPITAILSTLFMVFAVLNDYSYVVFANEHAASEATVTLNNIEANHQFSKSLKSENLLRDCFQCVLNTPDYFSILRPFSEIYVAKTFAEFKKAHPIFLSCNKNFSLTKAHKNRWCHKCPKCAFVFLVLAPFLSHDELFSIFDDNILNNIDMIDIYKDLLGLTGQKPWECVGTIEECRALLYHLSKDPTWGEAILIQKLLPDILKYHSSTELDDLLNKHLTFRGPNNIPPLIYNAW